MSKVRYFCANCLQSATDASFSERCGECGGHVVSAADAIPLAIALLEFAGWQPMETAPRDGTPIFISDPRYGAPFIVAYNRDARVFCTGADIFPVADLTGWLPLPKTGVKHDD